MAAMGPMMLMTPYQAINYMGQQFRPPPLKFGPPLPAVVPPAPPPALPARMMMPYYNPYPQPPNFWCLGANKVRFNKINADVNFTLPHLTPTYNYAFAALLLLKRITTDADTIKRWAILDSGATSHFLTTSTPATTILPIAAPIVARLPNGKGVHSTHTCTLGIPLLPPGARVAHIIPGLALHLLLSIAAMGKS